MHFQLSSTPLNLFNCLQVDLDAFVHTGDLSGTLVQQDSRGSCLGSRRSLFTGQWRLEMDQVCNFLSTRMHLEVFGGHTGLA